MCERAWVVPDLIRTSHRLAQQAHDRLTAQGAILLLPNVCYDEALMEVRRGAGRDRDLALRRLDEAMRWVDHIGLPNHVPHINELRDQLTAETGRGTCPEVPAHASDAIAPESRSGSDTKSRSST